MAHRTNRDRLTLLQIFLGPCSLQAEGKPDSAQHTPHARFLSRQSDHCHGHAASAYKHGAIPESREEKPDIDPELTLAGER